MVAIELYQGAAVWQIGVRDIEANYMHVAYCLTNILQCLACLDIQNKEPGLPFERLKHRFKRGVKVSHNITGEGHWRQGKDVGDNSSTSNWADNN